MTKYRYMLTYGWKEKKTLHEVKEARCKIFHIPWFYLCKMSENVNSQWCLKGRLTGELKKWSFGGDGHILKLNCDSDCIIM